MNQPKRNEIYLGDCREVLAGWPENCVDAVVTDPPYELGFMGKSWDSSGVSYDVKTWVAILRVLKPGGHLLAFGGTRTYHRMACAIEDAGFEIRDQLQWLYGSGFPKSRNVGDGRGTALKPANEPICLARKPLSEKTIAANVLRWGTGALNIDASKVKYTSEADKASATPQGKCTGKSGALAGGTQNERDRSEFERPDQKGRFPANVILDEKAGEILDQQSGNLTSGAMVGAYKGTTKNKGVCFGEYGYSLKKIEPSSGGASRFFYCAKASSAERGSGNNHPTVKPISLISYLVRLITPPAGLVLDPFLGSGTLMKAARGLNVDWLGIEMNPEYVEIAKGRISGELF